MSLNSNNNTQNQINQSHTNIISQVCHTKIYPKLHHTTHRKTHQHDQTTIHIYVTKPAKLDKILKPPHGQLSIISTYNQKI